tara:strand:+ start:2461 stop:3681 length:1221 start_codon:yes stop_codon:yes gene_type:complete
MKNWILLSATCLFFFNLNGQTFTNYTTIDGLLSDNVNCVDVASNDDVWFGTQSGVSVFDGTIWSSHTIASDAGFADNTIQAICVTSSDDVWIGTDFGASYYIGGSWNLYTTLDGLGSDQIKCITEVDNGDIWFGTSSGASLYDGTSWVNYGTAEGLPFGGVNSIEIQPNGDVWMGTGLSGMRILSGSTFTSITDVEGLLDNRIRATVTDLNNQHWVGTSDGITVLDNANSFSMNHTTMFTLPAPDTLNPVEDIKMDSQGNIWTGIYVDYLVTEGGVCAYNGSGWTEFHVADGLVGPVVRAIAINSNDDVWVATSTGVSLISDHAVGISEELNTVSFSIYPNPSTDIVYINTKEIAEAKEINIYNSLMQNVYSNVINGVSTAVEVNHFSKGVYFVQIAETTRKLIVH